MTSTSLRGIAGFSVASVLVGMLGAEPILAQVSAAEDGTRTRVERTGDRFQVRGGTRSADGANLFHSFDEFGLRSGQIADFLSNRQVQNILGRVVGGDASMVDGMIRVTGSNANLYLINPAGILFGPNASLDLSGDFTATTASGIGFGEDWLSAFGENDYATLTGSPHHFAFSAAPGTLFNAGDLSVMTGRSLALLGGTVVNTGTLTAPGGQITLAAIPQESIVRLSHAGMVLSLDLSLPDGQHVATAPRSFSPLALPELLAQPALDQARQAIVTRDGTVQLVGSAVTVPVGSGSAVISGRIDSSGSVGGSVQLVGDRLSLLSATIDASGDRGGGSILIGGAQGGRGSMPTAAQTFLDADTRILADAERRGDGGQIVVWSEDQTQYWGSVSARGGAQGGNGGFVEISGRQNLWFRGEVNLTAANGRFGTLLLDPVNITIADGEGENPDALPSDGQIFAEDGPDVDFTISEVELEELSAIADVILEATNHITIENLSDHRLTFAPGPGGSITFTADADQDGVGNFSMNPNDSLVARGRDINISGAHVLTGNIFTGFSNGSLNGGDIALTATSGDLVTGTLDSSVGVSSSFLSGGDITLRAGSLAARPIAFGSIQTGDITTSGVGDISANAAVEILMGQVNAIGFGGSNVRLRAVGDIEVDWIRAEGIDGIGATISIHTDRFFRATETFRGDGRFSVRGDRISIRHGGGRRDTPFVVGDAGENGTAGAIATNFSNEILPTRVIPDNLEQGNITIRTAVNEIEEPDDLDDRDRQDDPCQADCESDDSNLDFEPVQTTPTVITDARRVLLPIEAATGIKPALIYVDFVPATVSVERNFNQLETNAVQAFEQYLDRPDLTSEGTITYERRPDDFLELVLVTADGQLIRKSFPTVTRQEVDFVAQEFSDLVTDPRRLNSQQYLIPAQQLYQWLIMPLATELQQAEIDNLAFVMPTGLRSLPLAALHDGDRFLVEHYSVGLMPSLSITDTRYQSIQNVQVLAMGASEFELQAPLPAVPVELQAIAQAWPGATFLNESFNLQNLVTQRKTRPFGIVHLATHGEFRPGGPENSYIQLWNQRLQLDQIRQLDLNDPPVELLVLSACRTALGDEDAELGFAGLALQAGVKSALASLWYVSDAGTLGFMSEFYGQLSDAPIKAEALRRTQLAMLRGEVRLEAGQVRGSRGEDVVLPPTLASTESRTLSHPFYWAAFTMIGNPW